MNSSHNLQISQSQILSNLSTAIVSVDRKKPRESFRRKGVIKSSNGMSSNMSDIDHVVLTDS